MSIADLVDYIRSTYPEMHQLDYWGEQVFFYNPGDVRACGIYFIALKDHDTGKDRFSMLNRPNVYRLSLKIPDEDYYRMFPNIATTGVAGASVDFAALDTVVPHPSYGPGWVSILNPSRETFEHQVKSMMHDAYNVCRQTASA